MSLSFSHVLKYLFAIVAHRVGGVTSNYKNVTLCLLSFFVGL